MLPGGQADAAAAASAPFDCARVQVELHRAGSEMMRGAHELCAKANDALAAPHAQMNAAIAERTNVLQREMFEAFQRAQASRMAASQSGEAMPLPELVAAKAAYWKLQTTLCNLTVLDPAASDAYAAYLASEAEIRAGYSREMASLQEDHDGRMQEIFGVVEAADLSAQDRAQVAGLRAWYASGSMAGPMAGGMTGIAGMTGGMC
ncbi:hypothetical protein GCM10007285_14100 [Stappia taiwanensis]|uniref:hypothetical protein n=1 Tax=Stappia taiwanensis TaxID=992267 RepID=UPI001986ADC0|nr:hypothetical protein [Stappia taiwanensis]GGE87739.1 hypothetical protein GCM10007285_14100 [Stappia taiwanensis]